MTERQLPSFIFGSSSKFRLEVLKSHGIEPVRIIKPDIDEKAAEGRFKGQEPRELVKAVALAKWEALKLKVKELGNVDCEYSVCADQVVTWNGQMREKPESEDECRHFLKTYAQYPATTISAILVGHLPSATYKLDVDIAEQHFETIPDDVVDKLLEKGDVMHCAGGFTVEDPLLAPFLGHRKGTINSIEGMPMHLLRRLFSELEEKLKEI